MKIITLKKLANTTALIDLVGAMLVILNFIISYLVAGHGATVNMKAVSKATFPLLVIIAIIGIVTIVLGVLLIINFRRLDISIVAPILAILAGIFAWFMAILAFVFWLLSATLLLRVKINYGDSKK